MQALIMTNIYLRLYILQCAFTHYIAHSLQVLTKVEMADEKTEVLRDYDFSKGCSTLILKSMAPLTPLTYLLKTITTTKTMLFINYVWK